MIGRPTKYTKTLANVICARIACGESVRAICRDDAMPDAASVFRWLGKHKEFCEQYARATSARADAFAEEIIAISDTPLEGEKHEEGENADGEFSKTVREDMLGHRKLQVDTRKWLMARMQPKKYGDKVEQTLRGDGETPVQIELIDGTAANGRPEEPASEEDGDDGL